jgi:hypothetical protein
MELASGTNLEWPDRITPSNQIARDLDERRRYSQTPQTLSSAVRQLSWRRDVC